MKPRATHSKLRAFRRYRVPQTNIEVEEEEFSIGSETSPVKEKKLVRIQPIYLPSRVSDLVKVKS